MAQEEVFVSYSREDNDKILALTAKLRAAGVTNFGWMKNDPDFLSLRDDPKFQELSKGR